MAVEICSASTQGFDLAMTIPEVSLALIYLVVEWTIRLAALALVPFRRSPDSARAWLLLLLFLPIPGLLLYLLIGRPTYPRARRLRLTQAAKLLHDATGEIAHSQSCRRPSLPDSFQQAARLIENLGKFPPLGSNNVELLADYDGVIDRLVSDIEAAAHHVHLLMYIFADDATGQRVMQALAGAAKRGVTCRVLIDAIGSRPWARRVERQLSASGVRVAQALPIAPWRRGSARADLRNHRKIAIIDGLVGYVGSQNLVDAETARGVVNEELVARLVGPLAVEMQAVFAIDWYMETEEVLSGPGYFRHHVGPGPVTAQLMPSGPDFGEPGLGPLTVALIHAARHRVVLTTPYFIPQAALLQALRTAVLRGVAVHLIVPFVSDHLFVRLAQQSYYTELLEAGVQLHIYRDRFIHAKHLSIDEEVTLIGSSNVDVRSFILNAEVTLIAYDPSVTADLWLEQQRCIASSDHPTAERWGKRPLIVKLGENIARMLGPLL